MNRKLATVAVAAMLTVVGGAAAVSGTSMSPTADSNADAPHNAAVAATYDNGTVTVTVTNGGAAVENATVEVADEAYATDTNGTVVAENVSVDDELSVEVEAGSFESEQEYAVADGQLTLVSEEYEYEAADDRAADDEQEDEAAENGADDEEDEREDVDDEADENPDDDEEDEREDEEDDENEEDDDDDEQED